MKKSKIFILIFIAGIMAVPLATRAFSSDEFFGDFDGVEIINKVNVSANTGGNISDEGEITEGEEKVEVHIKNIIDGQEISPVDIEASASEVSVENKITAEGGEADVEREIEIDGEKTQENHEVDLNDDSAEQAETKIEKIEWWEDFKEEVKSFFENIFDIFSLATLTAFAEETVVETGDAVAEGEIENIVNSNIVEEEPVIEEVIEEELVQEEEPIQEESIPEEEPSLESSGEDLTGQADNDLIIENENEAVVENEAEVSADTGGNSVSGGGSSVINSGNAGAQANVVNIVNSNIFSSNGFMFFMNRFSDLFGNLNFNGLDFASNNDDSGDNGGDSTAQDSQGPCGYCQGECCGGDLTVNNENNAVITNTVIVRSSTGSNSSGYNSGNAEINTGDAYAAANVVNIANTNIIGSNYLLLVFNNFGDWAGDLIFPGKDFFSSALSQNSSHRKTKIENNNDAIIQNNAEVVAETGDNEANDNGSSVIQTGDAYSGTNIVNDINNNLFSNDNSVLVLLRVHGNWKGNVFSAPPGIFWKETDGGLEIFSDPDDEDDEGGTILGEQEIMNDNTAEINNNVQVFALTGENKIEDNGGNGAINTGNAYAVANIMNVVNSNIVGQNWLLAMINVFGDWEGDVAFGRPDLWLGASVESPANPARINDIVTYTLTYFNNGDADATNVIVTDDFDERFITIDNANGGIVTDNPGEIKWNVGTVPTGGSGSISYTAKIKPDLPWGNNEIVNNSVIDSFEDDGNDEDNRDTISLLAYRSTDEYTPTGPYTPLTPDPIWSITKNADGGATTFTASSTVDFTITVVNNGGSAYHAVLTDTIKNEAGEIIHEEEWDLDEVFPDEEITVTYTMVFSENTLPGTYTNYAQVKAIGRSPITNPFYGWFADSPVASSAIEIIGSETNEDGEEGESGFSFEDAENKLGEMKNILLGMSEIVRKFLPQVMASESSNDGSEENISGGLQGQGGAGQENIFEEVQEDNGLLSKLKDYSNSAAAFFGALANKPLFWSLLFIILAIIIYFLWRQRKDKR